MPMSIQDTLLLGCAYARESSYREALGCLRRVLASYERDFVGEIPAKLLSYFGLSLAMEEERINEAVVYCTRAIKKDPYQSDFYVNLARVHLHVGRRSEAVRVLEKGLRIDNRDPGILLELQELGVRRKPVLGFLGRGNPVNKVLGKFVKRFGSRRRKESPTLSL
ncbi:MAG TPA: tetratricopeptide repeat protein [Nitrospiria bacterium]